MCENGRGSGERKSLNVIKEQSSSILSTAGGLGGLSPEAEALLLMNA